jgi:Uma2 family endonuclease
MSTAVQRGPLVSPDDYLAAEIIAERKHEYVDGIVYLRDGESKRHNVLTGNVIGTLHGRLRRSHCQIYGSDLLVRVQTDGDLRFYYPDASIHCGLEDPEARTINDPSIIFEVLSESTARIDTGEKRMAYVAIPTLEAYVLVDSEQREVTVWRQRDGQWAPEVFTAPESQIVFASADCTLTVGEIYEGTGL